MQNFNFYKVNETLNHKYYQIPQELFINPLYKNALNSDSKLLYGFLLDRLSLSIKNNWHDENGNIYLIFTRKEVQDKLNLSDKTVTKAFKQLSDVNLIYEKKLKEEIRKVENKYEDEIYQLEKENSFLRKVINTFQKTVDKFIHWVCKKFSVSSEEEFIRDFQIENDTYLDPEKPIEHEEELEYEEMDW